MENKIEFNWETYQTGNYDCITRDGRKVEQLHKFDLDGKSIFGVMNRCIFNWLNNGIYWYDGKESRDDIFLTLKAKEDHFADIVEMVIPELKGILMEVSDEEGFKSSGKHFVVGMFNDKYLYFHSLEECFFTAKYARPIKGVKEAWVNVYENNEGELRIAMKEFNTRQEAILNSKFLNFKYIKTIRITNEKDGE